MWPSASWTFTFRLQAIAFVGFRARVQNSAARSTPCQHIRAVFSIGRVLICSVSGRFKAHQPRSHLFAVSFINDGNLFVSYLVRLGQLARYVWLVQQQSGTSFRGIPLGPGALHKRSSRRAGRTPTSAMSLPSCSATVWTCASRGATVCPRSRGRRSAGKDGAQVAGECICVYASLLVSHVRLCAFFFLRVYVVTRARLSLCVCLC